ncbi:hypothetical protein FRACYDRAFT_232322 [Fragilariopsis cylindrus CCMP1102]|uniref:Calcineurin-like phosphoesterase domain-containing protein n=1 Tax=Fragilariopsis cylindrus CCMP1102 TaxID=635003 RepID=A0A1E7FVJ7_9STRA|nr:hypothetical protein FRACYDRAFT_232322 [Fragilariopsis cylindrus CCMP1102]|eukprot:OEU22169.1 hypothetical protein FRACYDRAFT_232322 [Fragilariopsis cylindrus CCMP1102]
MVEISNTAISRSTLSTSTTTSTARKPVWLIAIYALFILVCLNAVRTYENQKKIVQSKIAESEHNDSLEIHDSAGAEQHVVSANYGSSMYGGSIHTSRTKSKSKSKTTDAALLAKLENSILPKPSDGSMDYITKAGNNSSDFNGFSFYVITDTPYTDWQEKRLRSQMADLRDYSKDNPQRNISLGLHLGDTQKVSNSLCAESAYERVSYIITKGPRPTFVVPGNNDWYNCPRREEAFGYFMNNFGPNFVSKWHSEHYVNLDIQRSEDNPELFNFYVEGILFIGVHMIDAPLNTESKTSRDKRMKSSMEWLAESVETNFAKRVIRGVFIMGHAGRSERNRPFFKNMAKYFTNIATREVPVMYLHGDGLTYVVDRTFPDDVNWDYFYDVQIEQSGFADPVIFDVAAQRKGTVQGFQKDKGDGIITTFGKGLFRLDQRQGRYENPMDIV